MDLLGDFAGRLYRPYKPFPDREIHCYAEPPFMAGMPGNEGTKDMASYNESEVKGSSFEDIIPQGRQTKGQKIKAHFRKWWWLHLILFILITLLIVLLL